MSAAVLEAPADVSPEADDATLANTAKARLRELHGDGEAERIERGVDQVLRLWRLGNGDGEDGDEEAFLEFAAGEFVPSGETLDATFHRLEYAFERLGGLMTSLMRDLRRGADVEDGPMLPVDALLAGYNPAAHLLDDLFKTRIAFVCLLNFPVSTLAECNAAGESWSRRKWAEARMTEGFSVRVPASVSQAISAARATTSTYVSSYCVHTGSLLSADGRRLFEPGERLLVHWGLRDALKALYVEEDGLERQRVLKKVFDRVVRQEIPAVVIDNPDVDWVPETNAVTNRDGTAVDTAREADERYRHWLTNFQSRRLADPYYPDDKTAIDRSFNRGREMSEERVREIFEATLSSPLRHGVGDLVRRRLGRDLEPFDIWFVGFRPRGSYTEAELDARVAERYANVKDFEADVPRLLRQLGFSEEKAGFVAEHIEVEPARGSGHAYGAARRDDTVLLRTRVPPGGMDYQGFNTAAHELGHNVEQVFSTITIDHTLLQGVPNTAFSEAFAFVFQARDLELLGLGGASDEAAHLNALDNFWATREIAGVALVDMAAWNWLYENPDATPAEFREAVLGFARDVWNRYFADVFGVEDETMLAVYQHMVNRALYVPDYPLGHIIAFQVERHLETLDGPVGEEIERICKLGRLTPDVWMRQAMGKAVSVEPLLEAATEALNALG